MDNSPDWQTPRLARQSSKTAYPIQKSPYRPALSAGTGISFPKGGRRFLPNGSGHAMEKNRLLGTITDAIGTKDYDRYKSRSIRRFRDARTSRLGTPRKTGAGKPRVRPSLSGGTAPSGPQTYITADPDIGPICCEKRSGEGRAVGDTASGPGHQNEDPYPTAALKYQNI